METATLAGGCFWCTEAIFKRLKGVASVIPGYTGGTKPNPTYQDVCAGDTGHTESIRVTFDPKLISYETLLEVFFHVHNPTTLNRQDNDEGTQYRSAIFYHNEEQRIIAEDVKKKINGAVTEIALFTAFYPAENYHQDYYAKNSSAPYCRYVIDPKISKLLALYPNTVKPEFHQ